MRLALTIVFCCCCMGLFGQLRIQVGDVVAHQHSLSAPEGEIEFLVIGDYKNQRKPVFLLLQGSRPVPLIVDYGDRKSFSVFPFDLEPLLDQYHVVVISKPFVPVVMHSDSLADGYMYSDTQRLYNKANHLETYVTRTNIILRYLLAQSWVDATKILVLGHSEGSTVAAKLGNNESVTHIVLGASNPLGRAYEAITRIRSRQDSGEISDTNAQTEIDDQYARWKYIVQNREDNTSSRGDTFKATYSFSEYLVDDLIALAQPIFIAYGTKDLSARSCDYLPIALERGGKTNYQIRPYVGRGHNFESFNADGSSNYDDMLWDKVIEDILEWAQ